MRFLAYFRSLTGGRVRFQEECREALGGNFFETLLLEVRFALRTLRKSPASASLPF